MENYEEKYKLALNRIKVLIANVESGSKDCISIDDIQEVYPELKESEDEQFRKHILKCCEETIIADDSGLELSMVTTKRLKAWLEKQGEQPKKHDVCDNCDQQGSCVSPCPMKLVEKQSEQKPTDKVEPKFKVGDWIVRDSDGFTTSIENIEIIRDEIYYYHQGGNLFGEDVDKSYHLWTIQDAKDGDVLYLQKDGKEHIIIYKGVIKERFRAFVSAYCAYNGIVDAFCFADVSRYVDIAYGGIMPATKEQRDQLEKAMADAGYTFDFEKKELKKIEQKSVEWSEEDEQHIDSLLKRLKGLCGNVFERTRFAISEDRDWLESLRLRNVWISVDEEVYVKEPVLAQKKDKSDPFKGYVVCCDHTLIPNVYERYMILGNIVSQSHWKPSYEHYELEEFAKIVRGNLTGISEAVQELFEAKYLQLTGNKMYGGYID